MRVVTDRRAEDDYPLLAIWAARDNAPAVVQLNAALAEINRHRAGTLGVIEVGQVYAAADGCAFRITVLPGFLTRCRLWVSPIDDDDGAFDTYPVGVADFVACVDAGLLVLQETGT